MDNREALRELRNPAVIAAFSGWNDAGEAASGVIEHLAASYDSEVVAALDPEEFYDFQVTRPTVRLLDGQRIIEWATTEAVVVKLPERDLVLIGGPEPNYRWRDFLGNLMDMVDLVSPELVIVCGAMLADSPHSRPIQVSASSGDPHLGAEFGLEESDYEGPTGIVGVFSSELEDAGVPTMSLWASVPHYVADPPNPKATLALLSRIEDILNTPLDTGDLFERGERWTEQVNELVADNPDIAMYISALEERSDQDTPAPTGDSIAAEFERYLRRRNRRRG
ncbi:MAG: PAC2 family protein [Propionibacteriaceae bacterium]|jgi:predicted ATP-grasp superfamily ATP-dependent carboligase|nr:PAC2 family protein [Propionibacteriaceae bacterium]